LALGQIGQDWLYWINRPGQPHYLALDQKSLDPLTTPKLTKSYQNVRHFFSTTSSYVSIHQKLKIYPSKVLFEPRNTKNVNFSIFDVYQNKWKNSQICCFKLGRSEINHKSIDSLIICERKVWTEGGRNRIIQWRHFETLFAQEVKRSLSSLISLFPPSFLPFR